MKNVPINEFALGARLKGTLVLVPSSVYHSTENIAAELRLGTTSVIKPGDDIIYKRLCVV